METFSASFAARVINLRGCGQTAVWPAYETQTLDRQANLVEAIIPAGAGAVSLIGHSYGGSVVMMAALRMGKRVETIVRRCRFVSRRLR